MRRLPPRLTKRTLRNHALALNAMHMGCPVIDGVARAPEMEEVPAARKRRGGKQPESLVNDAVKAWARARGDITLWRNNVGAVEWKPGRWLRYGLGAGSSDFVGFQSVVVTPAMVGKRVAVFLAVESKTEDGVLSDDQLRFIEQVRDAGGRAGVARHAGDCEELTRG